MYYYHTALPKASLTLTVWISLKLRPSNEAGREVAISMLDRTFCNVNWIGYTAYHRQRDLRIGARITGYLRSGRHVHNFTISMVFTRCFLQHSRLGPIPTRSHYG
jgi:hypothetical protein